MAKRKKNSCEQSLVVHNGLLLLPVLVQNNNRTFASQFSIHGMSEDVTEERFIVYRLWFQLISWHSAQALQVSMFEIMQNKLKWPPRLLWYKTGQQVTDNAVTYSKPTLKSQRGFGSLMPTISLTGIPFLYLELCSAITCPSSGIMNTASSIASLLVSHTSRS